MTKSLIDLILNGGAAEINAAASQDHPDKMSANVAASNWNATFKAMRRLGNCITPFLSIKDEGDCFEISWFVRDRARCDEREQWFLDRGYEVSAPSNVRYVDSVTSADAMLFKLTFGGAA